MAVESKMIDLGTKAPDFNLQDVVTGKEVSLDDFKDKKALLVVFMCRHCPYVKHYEEEIAKIGKDYADRDLAMVAISSNDPEKYPDDAPENLKKQAETLNFNFPYLYDETQDVAKAYTAVCTPDPFLFKKEDDEFKLVYRGRIDESRKGDDKEVTGKDLREAMNAVLDDREVSKDQKPSMGCSIKWRPGNEPDYASA